MIDKLRIMGIDPGAKRCGYSIIDFADPEESFLPTYVDSGVFGLERKAAEREMYVHYKARLIKHGIQQFEDLIELHEPDLAVFEFLPVANVGAAAGQRLLAFCVASTGQVICELSGVPWVEITASTVKKQITGKGRAKKYLVKKHVLEIFPQLEQEKKIADEIDAIAVALSWMKRKNIES